jgi:hypothetical protein
MKKILIGLIILSTIQNTIHGAEQQKYITIGYETGPDTIKNIKIAVIPNSTFNDIKKKVETEVGHPGNLKILHSDKTERRDFLDKDELNSIAYHSDYTLQFIQAPAQT